MIELADIALIAPDKWIFYQFNNLVLGQQDKGLGNLQISTAFRNDIPIESNIKAVQEIAFEYAGLDVGAWQPNVTVFQYGQRSYGSFEVPADDTYRKYWCSLGPKGIVLGLYQGKLPCEDLAALEAEVAEAQEIFVSVEYL